MHVKLINNGIKFAILIIKVVNKEPYTIPKKPCMKLLVNGLNQFLCIIIVFILNYKGKSYDRTRQGIS